MKHRPRKQQVMTEAHFNQCDTVFCLRFQWLEICILPPFLALMRFPTSWSLWRLLVRHVFLWYGHTSDGQPNITGVPFCVITPCTRLFLLGSYECLYHVLILENLKPLNILIVRNQREELFNLTMKCRLCWGGTERPLCRSKKPHQIWVKLLGGIGRAMRSATSPHGQTMVSASLQALSLRSGFGEPGKKTSRGQGALGVDAKVWWEGPWAGAGFAHGKHKISTGDRIIETWNQNYFGWKGPLKSLNPTIT